MKDEVEFISYSEMLHKLCIVPENMNVPTNEKQFELIIHTVKKVRSNKQLEIMIKVKQEFNLQFEFLQSYCPLNEFYEVYFFRFNIYFIIILFKFICHISL